MHTRLIGLFPRSPRLRFSLGALLALLTLLCAALGLFARTRHRIESRRALARQCEVHGYALVHDWNEWDIQPDNGLRAAPANGALGWLGAWLGDECFQRPVAIVDDWDWVDARSQARTVPWGRHYPPEVITVCWFGTDFDEAPSPSPLLKELRDTPRPWALAAELGGIQRVRAAGLVDADLECFAAMTELRYLDLGHSEITGEGLRHLEELPRLELLCLSATRVSDSALYSVGQIRGLRALYARHLVSPAALTAYRLKHLNQLANLRVLELDVRADGPANGISRHISLPYDPEFDVSLPDFELPNLERLVLRFRDYQAQWTERPNANRPRVALGFLRAFPKLRELRLLGCVLSRARDDREPLDLSHLVVLEFANAEFNPDGEASTINPEHFEMFCGLPNLEVLTLGEPIDDAWLPALLSLPSLRELNLPAPGLSQQAVRRLRDDKPDLVGKFDYNPRRY